MGLESSTRHCSHHTYHCSVPKGCPTSHQRDAAPSRIQNIVILEAWFLLAPTPFYCIYNASRIVWHCHCFISNPRRPMASPHESSRFSFTLKAATGIISSSIKYLYPKTINFAAVDFSECCSTEVILFFWRSVYLFIQITWQGSAWPSSRLPPSWLCVSWWPCRPVTGLVSLSWGHQASAEWRKKCGAIH